MRSVAPELEQVSETIGESERFRRFETGLGGSACDGRYHRVLLSDLCNTEVPTTYTAVSGPRLCSVQSLFRFFPLRALSRSSRLSGAVLFLVCCALWFGLVWFGLLQCFLFCSIPTVRGLDDSFCPWFPHPGSNPRPQPMPTVRRLGMASCLWDLATATTASACMVFVSRSVRLESLNTLRCI